MSLPKLTKGLEMGDWSPGPHPSKSLVPSGRVPHPHHQESPYTSPPVDMKTVGTTKGQDGDMWRKKRERRRNVGETRDRKIRIEEFPSWHRRNESD